MRTIAAPSPWKKNARAREYNDAAHQYNQQQAMFNEQQPAYQGAYQGQAGFQPSAAPPQQVQPMHGRVVSEDYHPHPQQSDQQEGWQQHGYQQQSYQQQPMSAPSPWGRK